MRGDVTDAGRQTNDEQLKIELLSQSWRLSLATFNQIKGRLPKEKCQQEAMNIVQRGNSSFWGCVFIPQESIKSYLNPKKYHSPKKLRISIFYSEPTKEVGVPDISQMG